MNYKKITWKEMQDKNKFNEWLDIIKIYDRCMYKVWTNLECCSGCIYLKKYWCIFMNLPICFNPILTRRTGIVGMACMGIGKQEEQIC